MSTPNPVTFPPLKSEFTWVNSTTWGGQPAPSGATEASVTIGIRADGDTTHSAGNYEWTVTINGNGMSETLSQLNAALGKPLPTGNYWAAIYQTDNNNGTTVNSQWSGEIPFSIPAPTPDIPTAFKAS